MSAPPEPGTVAVAIPEPRPAIGLLARAREHSLLRNSVFMIVTTIVNSLLGYGYWVLAARGYSAHDVGLATALIAAMSLTSLASNLGIGHMLVQRLPERRDDAEWSLTVTAGLVVATASGLVAGVVVALALPAASSQFEVLWRHPAYAVALAVGVAAWSVATLVDFVFIAERQTDKMLARNAAFAALKLLLLAVPLLLHDASALAIFASWLGATVLVSAGALYQLIPRLGRAFRPRLAGARAEMRAFGGWLAGHHLINLGGISPLYLLPMLVATRLSVSENGYFYLTWMVGGLFFIVSPAVAANLFAEGSHRPEAIDARARSASRIIAALLLPMMAFFVIAGPTIMSSFGPDYATHGNTLLLVLVASAVPDAITNIAVSVLRVRRRLAAAAALNIGMAVMAGALTWVLLPKVGIVGAGWAWLAAQTAGSAAVGVGVLAGRRRRTVARELDDERLRVCVVGPGTRFLSGVSYHTHALVEALSQRQRVSTILMRRLAPSRGRQGHGRVGAPLTGLAYPARVRVLDGVDWFWGGGMLRAAVHMLRERPNVLLLQWWIGTVTHSYLLLAWLARRRGARVVIEFHQQLDPGAMRRRLTRGPARGLARAVVRRADAFVVHTEHDRASLARTYPLGDRPVSRIPLGPPSAQVVAHGPARRHAPPGVCNLLYFGTIRPHKGLQDLLAAFSGLHDHEAERLWLTVVGETWDGWSLPAHLIDDSAHRERITFVNRYVHDDEVAAFFAGADAVVLPYRRSGGSGTLQLAMSHGLPVVVTEAGGLPDAAAGYEGAIFVPAGRPAPLREAILSLPEVAGRRFENPHTWAQPTAELETLFERVTP